VQRTWIEERQNHNVGETIYMQELKEEVEMRDRDIE
jgi:hypothetical protein